MPGYAALLVTGERVWDVVPWLFFVFSGFFKTLFGNDTARIAVYYSIYAVGIYLFMRYKKQERVIAFLSAFAAVFSTWVITWVMIGHNTKPVVLSMFPFIFLFMIVLLPLLLAWLVKPILVRATIYSPNAKKEDIVPSKPLSRLLQRLKRSKNYLLPSQVEVSAAERIWLQHRHKNQRSSSIWFFVFVAVSAGTVFWVIPSDMQAKFGLGERFGLFVSLVLHLAGLYSTVGKGDIISQSIGVLTMDQGLYLAVVKIVSIPVPATFFVISLYAYTFITVALLLVIIPNLRHETDSISLEEISRTSGLEG
jgi:hypothetical protein